MRKIDEACLAKRRIVARQFQYGLLFAARALHRDVDHTGSIVTNANEKREAVRGVPWLVRTSHSR